MEGFGKTRQKMRLNKASLRNSHPPREDDFLFRVAIWQGRFQNTTITTQCRQSLEKNAFSQGSQLLP